MTLNKRKLRKLGESWRMSFTKEQECIIIARFGEEPWPYEWSEQDISEQILQIVHDFPAPDEPKSGYIKSKVQNQ